MSRLLIKDYPEFRNIVNTTIAQELKAIIRSGNIFVRNTIVPALSLALGADGKRLNENQ